MLEELNYTSVMKPVFSPDRLATTDLTHTIIGASNLTNSVLASDLCRQALQEKRMEIQASPRSVEVKCSDVLHCQLGKVTGSPSFSCGSPLPPPVPPRSGGAACPLRVRRGPRALPARRRALKQRPARQPPALLLVPSRSPDSGWDSGMYRREKGEGELPDSQSGAVMGMEECEAADVTRVSDYAS